MLAMAQNSTKLRAAWQLSIFRLIACNLVSNGDFSTVMTCVHPCSHQSVVESSQVSRLINKWTTIRQYRIQQSKKKKKHIPFLIILIDRLVRVLAYSCRLLRSDSLHNRNGTVHLNAESVEGMHNNAAMGYTLALKPCYCMHSRTYIQMQQTIMERSRSYAKPIQANLHVKLQRAMFARFRKIA